MTSAGWIASGTETGHREWVRRLTGQARALDIPVFMKEKLVPIMGEGNMVQELPQTFCGVREEQKTWRK